LDYLVVSVAGFPPSKNGGPIEAPRCQTQNSEPGASFRRQKTAAPLKRCVGFAQLDVAYAFPPSKNGGPIEAAASRDATT